MCELPGFWSSCSCSSYCTELQFWIILLDHQFLKKRCVMVKIWFEYVGYRHMRSSQGAYIHLINASTWVRSFCSRHISTVLLKQHEATNFSIEFFFFGTWTSQLVTTKVEVSLKKNGYPQFSSTSLDQHWNPWWRLFGNGLNSFLGAIQRQHLIRVNDVLGATGGKFRKVRQNFRWDFHGTGHLNLAFFC